MNFKKILFDKASRTESIPSDLPVLELIKENIEDKNARHLMLITNSDSALDIITYYYQEFLHRSPEIIYGSQFDLDKNEEYSYVVLNKIIYCMEEGYTLILKDLDSVYGSLYDMLNQNYSYVAKRRNCRIAIGPHSNPMCHVHQDFRCIVLVDQKRLVNCDPPFLNRFEKQILNFENISEPIVSECVTQLKDWVESLTTFDSKVFTINDMFPSYSVETLPSLVLANIKSTLSISECVQKCKQALISTSTFDGITRTIFSRISKDDSQYWMERYQDDNHCNLADYYNECSGNAHVIMTYSDIMTDFKFDCLSVRVKVFKTERDFIKQIDEFFNEKGENNLLTIHFESHVDGKFVPMVKFIVDHHLSKGTEKKVFMILHITRDIYENANEDWKLNFMNGWKQVTIDDLTPSYDQTKLLDLLCTSEIFSPNFYSIENIIEDTIYSSLMKIDYVSVNMDYIMEMSDKIVSDNDLLLFIAGIIAEALQKISFDWRNRVAFDKKKLAESGCLVDAIRKDMQQIVQPKLLDILSTVERYSAFESILETSDRSLRSTWMSLTNKCLKISPKRSKIILTKGLYLPYSKWQFEIYQSLKVKLEMLVEDSADRENQTETLLRSLIDSSENLYEDADLDYDTHFTKDFMVITAQDLGLNMKFMHLFQQIVSDSYQVGLYSPKESLLLKMWNNQKSLLALVELINYCAENLGIENENINCLNQLMEVITLTLLREGCNPTMEWKEKISSVLQIMLEESIHGTILKILKDISQQLMEYPNMIIDICASILRSNGNLDVDSVRQILTILSAPHVIEAKMTFISRLEHTDELLELICKELATVHNVKYLTPIVYQLCSNQIEYMIDGNFEDMRYLNDILLERPYCPLYFVLIDVMEELLSDFDEISDSTPTLSGNEKPNIERAYFVALFRRHLQKVANQEIDVSAVLATQLSNNELSKYYVLKCIRQSFSNWLDFKQHVEENFANDHWMDINLTNESFDSLGYNIFRSLDLYKKSEKAFEDLYLLKETSAMTQLIENSKTSRVLLYTLLGLIANNIHFSTTDNQKLRFCVEFLSDKFVSFSRAVSTLVNHLLNKSLSNDCRYVMEISFICLAVSLPENPFSIFIKNPNNVRSTFVVTAEDDILGGILKAINNTDGAHSRYRCSCGYVYLIGNCGRPATIAKCPGCQQTIGGQNHTLIQGSRIDNANVDGNGSSSERGFIVVPTEKYHSVRSLSPSMFRIWHFYINSVILKGLQLGIIREDEVRNMNIQNHIDIPFEHFSQTVAKDWDILVEILDQPGENLCFMLQKCIVSNFDYLFGNTDTLDHEDKRIRCENHLLQNTSALFSDINQSIRLMRAHCTQVDESNSAQSIIEETFTPNSLINQFTEFRITSSPSVQGMRALFMSSQENRQLYPFLNAYLTYEKELEHLETLWTLINFSNSLLDSCDNVIERSKAETTQMLTHAQNYGLVHLFDKLVAELSPEKATRYGCYTIKQQNPNIGSEMLSFFLVEDKQEAFGLYICAALEGYSEVQNNFIRFALQSVDQTTNLGFLKSRDGIIGVQSIPVQKAQKKDLIIIDPDFLEGLVVTFSYKNIEYGKGTSIGYLFDKIEFSLASKYILGKKNLTFENLRSIKYLNEAFCSNADFSVRDKISNPLPLDGAEMSRVKSLTADLPRLVNIQGSLQRLLEIMNIVNFDPDISVSAFCSIWKINLSYKEQFFTDMTLNKVVNLFEFVEEVVFDFDNYYLSGAYKTELEVEVVEVIINSCNKFGISLTHLTTALKRLISRFLAPGHFGKNTDPLMYYIIMESLWPISHQQEITILGEVNAIPSTVLLCHANHLCHSLANHIKEQEIRKAKEEAREIQQQEPTLVFKKPEEKKKPQQGKRRAINA